MSFGNIREGGTCHAIAISADGKLVVTGNANGRIDLHEPETKRLNAGVLPNLGATVSALAISPDRRFVAAAGDSPTRHFLAIYDLAAGKEVQRFENTPVVAGRLKFASDSNRLLASTGDKMRVFDLVAGGPAPVVSKPTGDTLLREYAFAGTPASIVGLATGKDGRAVTILTDRSLQVWSSDKDNMKLIKNFDDPNNIDIQKVVFVGNTALVSSRTGTLQTIDLVTGQRQLVANLDTLNIGGLDLSDDGRLAVLSAFLQDNKWVAIVVDLKENKELTRVAVNMPMNNGVRFLPGGQLLLTASADNVLSLWDPRTGKQQRQWVTTGAFAFHSLAITSDGLRMLSGGMDGTARIWDLASGKELYRIDGPKETVEVSISPNGRIAAARWENGPKARYAFWEIESRRVLGGVEPGNNLQTRHMTFLDDNHLVLRSDNLTEFKVYEVRGKGGAVARDPLPSKEPKPPVLVEKIEPPTNEAVAEAVGQLRESDAHKADYGKTRGGDTRELKALSEKLLAEARTIKDDPVRRYALLTEARDLAGRAADAVLSLQAVDELASEFAIDVRAARATAMVPVGKAVFSGPGGTAALNAMLPLLEEAVKEDDYETVTVLLPPIRQAATLASDGKKQALERVAYAEHLRKEYEAIRKDLQTLKDTPNEPSANLAVGKYLCFHKMDWEKGFPLLVRGNSDGELAAAIKKDQAAEGVAAPVAARLAAAEAWDHLASEDAGLRAGLQRRAYHWYARALPDLVRADQARVEKRLTELLKVHPDFLTGWETIEVPPTSINLGGLLRLRANQVLLAKTPQKGPVEIVAVVRSSTGQLQVDAYRDSRKLFGLTPSFAQEHIHAWFENEGGGSSGYTLKRTMPRDEWITLTIVVKEDSEEIRFGSEGNHSARVSRTVDMARPGRFSLKTMTSLEVRSFEVKPYKP